MLQFRRNAGAFNALMLSKKFCSARWLMIKQYYYQNLYYETLLTNMQSKYEIKRYDRLTCTQASGTKGISTRNLNHMPRHIYVDMNRTFSNFRGSNPLGTRLQILIENIRSKFYKS